MSTESPTAGSQTRATTTIDLTDWLASAARDAAGAAGADVAWLRHWTTDPANAVDAALVIAGFVADEGMRFVRELVAGRPGPAAQVVGTVDEILSRLRRRIERWEAEGRPELGAAPPVRVEFASGPMERAAEALLARRLPPGVTYRFSNCIGGARTPRAPWGTWTCRLSSETTGEISGGEAPDPLRAAEQAAQAWDTVANAPPSKPPKLNAPSADPSDAASDRQQEKRVS